MKKKKREAKRRGAQRSVKANLALITPHTPKSFITNATTSAVLQTARLRIKFCECAVLLS